MGFIWPRVRNLLPKCAVSATQPWLQVLTIVISKIVYATTTMERADLAGKTQLSGSGRKKLCYFKSLWPGESVGYDISSVCDMVTCQGSDQEL